jgi:hypothetical protein
VLSIWQGDDPVKVVTTAVAPVVMISATAILISGISSKHQSLSDRLRQLTAEYRNPQTSEDRRLNLQAQIPLFQQRIHFVARAHICLFCATACFVSMVLVLAFTQRISVLLSWTLPSFLIGVVLLLLAVVFEILELLLAGKTLHLETENTLKAKLTNSVRHTFTKASDHRTVDS